jgi:cysteine desulfurase
MFIYLDNCASTPLFPEVCEAMDHWNRSQYGNPSARYRSGQKSKASLEESRAIMADELDCSSGEIIFCSGGTEANNFALMGAAYANKPQGKHILISAVEHPSVMQTSIQLKNEFEVEYIYPDSDGNFSPNALKKMIRKDTILISMMYINNETGIVHPISQVSELCKDHSILFHCDAVQAFGKYHISLKQLPIDFLSISAHKIGGPKGVGALYVKSGSVLKPQILGGTQEKNRRAGTENISGILGMAKAVERLKNKKKIFLKTLALQAYFEDKILENFPFASIIGKSTERSPFISNVVFRGGDNESILIQLDMKGIEVSAGSACSSGSQKLSPVLLAMNIKEDMAKGAIRFSYGVQNTKKELDYVINCLKEILR